MHYFIGIDAGSTGIKAIALHQSQILSSAHARMTYHHEGKTWEYDAEEYYNTIAALVRSLTQALPRDSICDGISLVCASGNAVLLKEGKPLTPIISWMDDRGEEDFNQLFPSATEQSIHTCVGWHKTPKFPLVQLSRIRQRAPELIDQADIICEGSCYVNYRLCGVFAMDHSTATTFYLQDQRTFTWNRAILEPLHIPVSKLPPLVPVGTQIGAVTEQAARDTGLPVGTPVVTGCYDGASAARSAGITKDSQMLVSCGTSWVCLYPSKDRQYLLDLGTMIDPYLESDGLWIGMTSLGEVGVLIESILSGLFPDSEDRIADFNRMAEQSVPGANGLLINPMRLDVSALTRYPLSDICRALMEGVVYSIKRQKEALPRDLSQIKEVFMVGGPSNSNLWPQILSDVLQLPVCVSNGSNACAMGAAIIAGIGTGHFSDLTDALQQVKTNRRRYQPSVENRTVYSDGYHAFVRRFPRLDQNMH